MSFFIPFNTFIFSKNENQNYCYNIFSYIKTNIIDYQALISQVTYNIITNSLAFNNLYTQSSMNFQGSSNKPPALEIMECF